MAEISTVARPYAQAIFDLAKAGGALAAWSEKLEYAAGVSMVDEVGELISSPHLTKDQIAETFIAACGDLLDDQGENLIKVLMDNHRLSLLPEIAAQYEYLRAEEESTLTATVSSAFELNDSQKTNLTSALKKRFDREIELECSIDQALLGGMIIRAGDVVIDGSALGKLNKLAVELAG